MSENTILLKYGNTAYSLSQPPENKTRTQQDLVVCLHGITWWSYIYNHLKKDLLKQGYRVLTLDFYGRGNSDAPNVNYNLNLFVEQIEELLEALKISEKFILLGLSMGGGVAAGYAAKHYNRILKLLLLAPAGTPVVMPFIAKLTLAPVIGYPIFALFGKSTMLSKINTDRFKADFVNPDKVDPDIMRELMEKTIWQISEKQGFLSAFYSTLQHFPLNDLLSEYAVIGQHSEIPVHLIWGTKDEEIPFENSKTVLSKIPHAKLITIEGGAHAFILEQIEDSNNIILDAIKDGIPFS